MPGSENIWMRHWREVNADDGPPLSVKAGERGEGENAKFVIERNTIAMDICAAFRNADGFY